MQFVGPTSILSAPPEHDIFVVRGDEFTLTMGFQNVDDVLENPAAFRLRVGFRRRQSDFLSFILSRNATLEVNPTDTYGGQPVDLIATAAFSPQETQQLPPTGCVYLVEWTDAVGGANRRILQGRVNVSD